MEGAKSLPAFLPALRRRQALRRVYTAETEDALYDLLDQESDAGDYEYTIIREGFGIEFRKGEGNVKYKIGTGYKAFEAATSKADWVYMTDPLRDAVTRGKGLKWRKLYEG
jgi:hypothetical protein